MPRLRRASSREIVSALSRFGFQVVSQRGSHVKLSRTDPDGSKQTLTIPNQSEMAPGTLRAVFRQASRFVSADALRPYFYHD